MKRILFLFLFITIIGNVYSQCPFDKCYKFYTGSNPQIIATSDHGFVAVVTAAYDSLNPGYNNGQPSDLCVLKIDSCGNVIWQTHGGKPNIPELAVDVVEGDSGNYFVTGIVSGMASFSNITVSKFSHNGQLLWGNIYSNNTLPSHLIKEKNKNRIIVTGDYQHGSPIIENGYILEIDGNGVTKKSEVLPYINVGIVNAMQINDTSYLMILQSSDSLYLIETDTSFNVRWKKNFFSDPQKFIFSGLYGSCLSYDGKSIALVLKAVINNAFVQEIMAQFDLNGGMILYKLCPFEIRYADYIIPTSNNGYLIGQSMYYTDSSFNKIKFIQSSEQYTSFVENSDKSVTAACQSYRSGKYWELNIVRTDALGNIYYSAINEKQGEQNNQFNFYPNPATSILNIQTNSNQKLTAQLFDVTGKAVTENVSFVNNTTINLQELPQGLYIVYLRDTAGQLIKTQKVSIVK